MSSPLGKRRAVAAPNQCRMGGAELDLGLEDFESVPGAHTACTGPNYARRVPISRTPVALAVACAAAACTGVAAATTTPAWSYVPATVRAQLAAQSGGVLYLPARTPLFYRYRTGAKVDRGKLSVTFTNRVRIRQGLWRWTRQSFLWQVLPLPASATCTTWAKPDKTYQYAGNKVYFA